MWLVLSSPISFCYGLKNHSLVTRASSFDLQMMGQISKLVIFDMKISEHYRSFLENLDP